MRRGLLAVLLAGVLLPAGLAGCGIPHETEVQVDGRPEPTAEAGSLNGRDAHPPTQAASREPAQFILNYLSAAAGEREQAYSRVKEFIAPESQPRLREKQQSSEIELTVVRLLEKPEVTPPNNEGTSVVTVPVQQVGVLRADGILAPPVASETKYVFRLRPADAGSTGLLITDLPNVLLLSDAALRYYYGTHTIYFWNSDQTRLVPDQRYLPSTVPTERRVTEVIKWLAGGPPDWLAPGVTRLPDGTAPINNATGSDGHWEVNLTMPGANELRLARLATQLAWSLPDFVAGELQLKIQNQNRQTVDLRKERETFPLYATSGAPQRFCVYDGVIHPLSFPGESTGPVPVSDGANKGVVSAALSRAGDEVLAALVVTRSDHRQRLMVGVDPAPVGLFTGSENWFGSIGRPTWLRSLDQDHAAGLVVADGRLYRFDSMAVMTPVPLAVPGAVTTVASSFDGHRVAMIIGGALYVATLSLDGGVVTVNQPRRLVTRLNGLTAVDWYAENELVFAGNEGGRPAIYQTTVDGGLETALKREVGAEVTQLAAYPGKPVDGLPSGSYMYEANKAAYRNNPFDNIRRQQVVDAASPAPGVRAGNPTAPFFLY
ncbi:Sporulation and spore germination [Micromonospora viridifaciens]|uniref:Sporulation and spore germination n=1 Tax=Micromonospora viridifaciens TaxID=1881 RepID=A0A1C4ZRH7_MICVI|nr:LpqB family beta-propeller domain-containing protein [Micromonospora viridifaciens]SCF35578.1 Sporulation and spore germination [Micromonospora viridifaciens]